MIRNKNDHTTNVVKKMMMSIMMMLLASLSLSSEVEVSVGSVNSVGSVGPVAEMLEGTAPLHDDRSLQWVYNAEELGDCGPYQYPYTYQTTGLTRCLCKDGFRGWNCTFCESDDACASIIPALEDTLLPNERITGSTCITDQTYQKFHDLKTYDCVVDESLQYILTGLEVHANCNTRTGECIVALNLVNRRPVVDPFYIKCISKGCKFVDNESSVRCDSIECTCSDLCSELATTMLGQLRTDQGVTLEVSSEGYLDVDLPGSPLPIKGQCDVAACAFNKVIEVEDNAIDSSGSNTTETIEVESYGNVLNFEESNSDFTTANEEQFGEVLGMKTVSGLLLIIVDALALLVIVVSWCSSQRTKGSQAKLETRGKPVAEDTNSYSITSFEWDNISCRIDTKNKKQHFLTEQNDNNDNDFDDHMSDTGNSARVNQKNGYKNILHRVSGKVHSGSVMGILGPSGSGKSSLMNALYGINANNNILVTGQVLVDGKRYRSRDIRKICSFVHQDDCLFPTLTVRECIEYSALLRLPKTLSLEEKLEKVQMVIEELRLESVADNRIGASYSTSSSGGGESLFSGLISNNASSNAENNVENSINKEGYQNKNASGGVGSRISGGERKRVSIGMELVTSPQVLFLDEPTSGLDSYTSYSIMKTLKELAQSSSTHHHYGRKTDNSSNDELGNSNGGRIVILSIHQPNAKVFNMLDQVLLLYKGKTMYNGLTTEVSHNMHLYSGIVPPENENVADYMLDTISEKNSRETFIQNKFKMSEKELIQLINEEDITKSTGEEQTDQLLLSSKDDFNTEETSTFFTEVPILLQRTAKNISRDKSLFLMHMAISLILGICGGFVFYNVEDNLAGFQNRTGAFYFILTFFGFSSFSSMDAFINERRIFVKETGAKYYSVSSYFIAKTSLDIVVLRIIPITVFASLFYWIMGLQPLIGNFIIFLACLVTFNVAAGSVSVCIGTFSSSVGTASLISTVIFLIMLLFGGFLVNLSTLHPIVAYMKYLSIFNYAFEIMITNELYDTVLTFDAPGYPAIPVYGTVFLESLNVYYDNQLLDILALCIITVVLNIITYILLRLRAPK